MSQRPKTSSRRYQPNTPPTGTLGHLLADHRVVRGTDVETPLDLDTINRQLADAAVLDDEGSHQ